MTINDRVKLIREDSGLNITEFAAEIKLSKSTISLIEKGERSLTERTQRDICNRFQVNPVWLETGKGERYIESENTIIRVLKSQYKLDELDIKIIKGFLHLTPEERKAFVGYVKKIGGAN